MESRRRVSLELVVGERIIVGGGGKSVWEGLGMVGSVGLGRWWVVRDEVGLGCRVGVGRVL